MNTKTLYFIGIGGIGISALARYYKSIGYDIYGTDLTNSPLIEALQAEGLHIHIGDSVNKDLSFFSKIIYTEAVKTSHNEIVFANELGIPCLGYPEALSEIVNSHKLIAIAGTHGKSTTTSLTSLIFKNSEESFNALVGSVLKEFGGKNFFSTPQKTLAQENYFIIEACEYKRSFLRYKPSVGIIINIELDHLDYYRDLTDYISAYSEFIHNILPGGFAILNGEDKNCKTLLGLRSDITYIEVFPDRYKIFETGEEYFFPEFTLQIPGNHILFDAHIAYTIALMAGINEINIIEALENYTGIWRRMENIGTTLGGNILMSDYGHHPTEISLTLQALKEKNPEKHLYTIFQPHQYSRTLELLDDFLTCFSNTDTLVIPNIYESRDSEEDKKKINAQELVTLIKHQNVIFGDGLENTSQLIKQHDSSDSESIILLLGAGDIDTLRNSIQLK